MKTIHPRKNDKNKTVLIKSPSTATPLTTWSDKTAISTVIPEGVMPESINGVPVADWKDAPSTDAAWEALAATMDVYEYPAEAVSGKAAAAGVVTVEPDGRVWVVSPTNYYGGYTNTFPKGKCGALSHRATALKEVFEESGLRVQLICHVCDSVRDTTVARYYLARRIGGNPARMDWESQAVHLVPMNQLKPFVTHPNDANCLKRLPARVIAPHPHGISSGHRFVHAIAEYKDAYGMWPTRIRMPTRMGEALLEHNFSPLGWQMLEERVQVILDPEMNTVTAEGLDGRRVEYLTRPAGVETKSEASLWLWGVDFTQQ